MEKQLDIREVWMRLEALSHLRGHPNLKRLHDKIVGELAEIQDQVAPAPEEPKAVVEPTEEAKPRAIPSSDSDAPVRRDRFSEVE